MFKNAQIETAELHQWLHQPQMIYLNAGSDEQTWLTNNVCRTCLDSIIRHKVHTVLFELNHFYSCFSQPCYRVKTIAIETGIQNTSIAYLLLVFSLPAPDGDMAAVGPMASALLTPLPLFILVIIYLLYKKLCKKKTEENGK